MTEKPPIAQKSPAAIAALAAAMFAGTLMPVMAQSNYEGRKWYNVDAINVPDSVQALTGSGVSRYVAPPPVAVAPPPSLFVELPVYVAPPPLYVEMPVYVAPAPVYVAPAPVYVAPAPVYVAPAPVCSYYQDGACVDNTYIIAIGGGGGGGSDGRNPGENGKDALGGAFGGADQGESSDEG